MSPSRLLLTSAARTATATARIPITSSRAAGARPTRQLQTLYQPLFHNRAFLATMAGTEGKRGVHNLTTKEDYDQVLKEPGVMVLDCYATWCGPCKVIAPQVVKFSDIYSDAKFCKLDVDEVPHVAQELGIRAMPTFLIYKDGAKVGEVVGANPKALEAAIAKHVGEKKPADADAAPGS